MKATKGKGIRRESAASFNKKAKMRESSRKGPVDEKVAGAF
jgi:hypothetical protein